MLAVTSEVLSTYGGRFMDVAAEGGKLYGVAGNTFAVFDTSNPSEPRQLSALTLPATVYDLEVLGSYVYASGSTAGLTVIDVSDPEHPTIADCIEDAVGIGLAIADGKAYLVGGNRDLRIVDLTDPVSGAETRTYTIGEAGDAFGYVTVAGQYAFTTTGSSLQVVDLSPATGPVVVGRVAQGGYTGQPAVTGSFVYAPTGCAGLRVIDASVPSAPAVVSQMMLGDYAKDVEIAGNYAYAVDLNIGHAWQSGSPPPPCMGPTGLRVIDISDPAKPVLASFHRVNYEVLYDVAVDGTTVYAASHYSGAYVFDVSAPDAPQRLAIVGVASDVVDTEVVGSILYMLDSGGSLVAMDVSGGSNPLLVGSCYTAMGARGMTISGDRVYVAHGDGGLSILDAHDPSRLEKMSRLASIGSVQHVVVQGDYAYVMLLDQGIRIIDVLDPSAPVERGLYAGTSVLAVSGAYAYVRKGTGLDIVDVSDPNSPTRVSTYNSAAESLIITGSYACLGKSTAGVEIVDVSNPKYPVRVGSYDDKSTSAELLHASGFLFYGTGPTRILDISFPAQPRSLGFFNLAGDGLSVYGPYAYVAQLADMSGLQTARLSGAPINTPPAAIALSSYWIPRGAAAGVPIGELLVSDSCGGGPFTCELIGTTDDSAMFVLNANSLSTGASYVDDGRNSYTVRVRVTDFGGLSVEQSLVLRRTSISDAPTDITLVGAQVVENSAGAAAGLLEASSADQASFYRFELVSGEGDTDNALFQVSGNALQTAAALDFEEISTRSVRVRVTDGEGRWLEKALEISVLDANDAPTAISAGSGAEDSSFSVALTTVDQDPNDRFTYQLTPGEGSDDNGSFKIVGAALAAKYGVNFEQQSVFTVRLRSTDAGGLWTEQVVHVRASNKNEMPTAVLLQGGVVRTGAPAGTTVGYLTAQDVDGSGSFTYGLTTGGPDNGMFRIEGNRLITTQQLGAGGKTAYNILVSVRDEGPYYTYPTSFTINVLPHVAESSFSYGSVEAIGVIGTTAYVCEGADFVVYDVTVPNAPVVLARLGLADVGQHIVVVDSYAYVAARDGLRIVDISDVRAPKLVSSFRLLMNTLAKRTLAVSRGIAYVADRYHAVTAIDVANPAAPIRLATMISEPRGIAVVGNRLFVSGLRSSSKFHVVDITDPANCLFQASSDATAATGPLAIVGDLAYIAGSDKVLYVVDISDGGGLSVLATLALPDAATDLAVDALTSTVYLVSPSGLRTVDVSDPLSPRIVGESLQTGLPYSMSLSGGHAYVGMDKGLALYEISDPANPTFVGLLTQGAGQTRRLTVTQGELYVLSEDLHRIDLSSPDQIRVDCFAQIYGLPSGVAKVGQWVYASNSAGELLRIEPGGSVTVLAPANSVGSQGMSSTGAYFYEFDYILIRWAALPDGGLGFDGYVSGPYSMGPLASAGSMLYSVGGQYGYVTTVSWDGAKTTTPTLTYGGYQAWSYDIALAGPYAYVAQGPSGLSVFDTRTQKFIGNADSPGTARAVAVSGNYAYIADSERGVRIFDVTDPTKPVMVGAVETSGDALDLEIIAGHLFIADSKGGLKVVPLLGGGASPTDITLTGLVVPSTTPAGLRLGEFNAVDSDFADSFTYDLATGDGDDDNALFRVVGRELQPVASLDEDDQPEYSIRVRATDAAGHSVENVFVLVDRNRPPTDLQLSASEIPENAPAGTAIGLITATDPDVGDTTTLMLVSGVGAADNALFTLEGNELRAVGSFDFEARSTYSFRVRATDSGGCYFERPFTIYVTDVNEAPVVADSAVATDEDVATTGVLPAVDPEGTALVYRVVTGPEHGALVLEPDGGYTYAAAADYYGVDSFCVVASDGVFDSNVATVSVTVAPVNDAPVAAGLAVTTDEDEMASGTVVAMDIEGDALTYRVATGPAHGTLILHDDGRFEYTPAENHAGSDSFTYLASDGVADSNIATVTITVAAVNDAPAAAGAAATTDEDTGYSGSLLATDIDGDALTYRVTAGPEHGVLSMADGQYLYVPADHYFGSDSFTFVVNDGAVDSAAATVTITVNPVNDAPVAADAAVTTDEDMAVSAALAATDVDGDALSYRVSAAPAHGTLVLETDGRYTYTPAANVFGSDSFTFVASDGAADSNVATVTITITPVGDVPVADDLSIITNEDTAVSGVVTAQDADGDSVTFQLMTDGQHGSAQMGTDGRFTYTPHANYFGTDQFTFAAIGGGLSEPATVSVTITPVNDPPVGTSGGWDTYEDAILTARLHAVDVDSVSLTYRVTVLPSHGTLQLAADGNFSHSPDPDYVGVDWFTYVVSDGQVDSEPVTAKIECVARNDAPRALALDGDRIPENTPAGATVGRLIAHDVDAGDAFAFELVNGDGATDNASFTILGDELRTAGSFDFETKSSYLIRVRVMDSGGLSREQSFVIAVEDVAEVAMPWVIEGTAGNDEITIEPVGTDYRLTFNGEVSSRPASLVSLIEISAGDGDDRITIAPGVIGATILAGAGHDSIVGGEDGDSIYGGDGNDTIIGNDGIDTIYGNFGDDVIAGGLKRDSIMGGLGADTITGGDGPDSLFGGDQRDVIRGGKGADYIEGRGKADTIYGGDGNDTINSGAGSDLVYGEGGDDELWAWSGADFYDTLDGGAGWDRYEADASHLLVGVEELIA